MAFDAVSKASGTTVTSMATLRTDGIKGGEVGMTPLQEFVNSDWVLVFCAIGIV